MKTFYVGTLLARRQIAREVAAKLIEAGFKQTFDWTKVDDLTARPLGDAERGAVAVSEIDGVKAADFGVILLPGGRGTHAELGATLALGKHVYLHAFDDVHFIGRDAYICAFYEHPLVTIVVGDYDKLLTTIKTSEYRL